MAEENKVTISKLTVADLDAVDDLMKRYKHDQVSYLLLVLEDYLRKRISLGSERPRMVNSLGTFCMALMLTDFA